VTFSDRLKDMQETHDRKNADYGTAKDRYANIRASGEFGVPPWLGAIIRLNDKITRIKAFAQKGVLENESLEDSLRDIATYGAIAWDLYLEEDVTPVLNYGLLDPEEMRRNLEMRENPHG
jgi:hypothetical protein